MRALGLGLLGWQQAALLQVFLAKTCKRGGEQESLIVFLMHNDIYEALHHLVRHLRNVYQLTRIQL